MTELNIAGQALESSDTEQSRQPFEAEARSRPAPQAPAPPVGHRAELDVAERLMSVNWDFAEVTKREAVHDVHPYPARFIPQIPRSLIQLFHPGDGSAVLDPFCGSGTTLVEAVLADRPAMGIDLHPLATLIAKVKTTPLDASLLPLAREMVARAQSESVSIPAIPRVDHWFLPQVQDVLARLVSQINRLDEEATADALKVALSRIIVRVSNQESDTRYAAVTKEVTSQDVYAAFLASVKVIEDALGRTYGGLFPPRPRRHLLTRNILEVAPADIPVEVGLVVTSPPYPNAYEYWLYHKYRMYWLGMDPLAVREAEIGARPHFFKKNHQTEKDFEDQMSRTFNLLSRVMKPGALACFVVGRSIIHGRFIDNVSLLGRAAKPHGFRRAGVAERRIPSTRKAFNPAHSTIDRESLVIFVLEDGQRWPA